MKLYLHAHALGLLSTVTCAMRATALSAPPPGAVTVGAAGTYASLSAALKDTSSLVYFVFAGTYIDTAVITRAGVRVYGETPDAASYSRNTVTITNNVPASAVGNNNDKSGTVQVHAANVSLYNLNIANTYGKPVDQSQAIALSVQAGSFGGYGLKITGDQDTLLANVGVQYYANSWIEGAVDFIFGQKASVWITRSVINTIGNGYITASGRSTDDAFWYVVDNSTIQGSGRAFLGRPWGDHARVVFQLSTLGANVPPAGWSVWNTDDPRTSNVTFAEFANTGPGAGTPGTRAAFSTQLARAVDMETVLGSTDWIDRAFL